MIVRGGAALAALLVAATPAHAHNFGLGIGGVYGGLLHPLLVPAHLLALVGLGLLIGQQVPRRRAVLLAAFAASLVGGLVVIVSAVAVTDADYAVLGAAAATGLGVVVARPLWLMVSIPVALVTGAAIALDSVPHEISMTESFLALVGTVVAAFVIAVALSALAAGCRHHWQRIGVRVAGSWIAASAVMVLALRLARSG